MPSLASLPLAPGVRRGNVRLEALFTADKLVRDGSAGADHRHHQEIAHSRPCKARLTDPQGETARRKRLRTERDGAFTRTARRLSTNRGALASLYAPLMTRIASSSGTLKKLGFSSWRDCRRRRVGSVAEEELLDRSARQDPYPTGAAPLISSRDGKRARPHIGTAAEVKAAAMAAGLLGGNT